jgi:hypothetical protein
MGAGQYAWMGTGVVCVRFDQEVKHLIYIASFFPPQIHSSSVGGLTDTAANTNRLRHLR